MIVFESEKIFKDIDLQRRKTEDATLDKSLDKAISQSKDDELAHRSKHRTLLYGTSNKQGNRTVLFSVADTFQSVLSETFMGKLDPELEPLDSKHRDSADDPDNQDGVTLEIKQKPDAPKTSKDYFCLALPHIALVVVAVLYCISGAAIFLIIEQPHEVQVKSKAVPKVHEVQQQLMDHLWEMLQNNSTTFSGYMEQGTADMNRLMAITMDSFDRHRVIDIEINTNQTICEWTFPSALFFAAVVMTTIGYGNLTPVTVQGRVFCMVFAIFGIPLALITIADLAKFVASIICYLFENAKYLRKRIHKRFKRKHLALSGLGYTMARMRSQMAAVATETKQPSELRPSELKEFASMPIDKMPLPPSLVLLILLGYSGLGAVMYHFWEDWSFVDSFYFCFVYTFEDFSRTMTTVGFGDIVPRQQAYLVFSIIYIFFGLILTTMCIDLVGSHYIRKIHYMGRKMQDARQALEKIGSKAANVGEWMWQLRFVQKKYGLTDQAFTNMVVGQVKQHQKEVSDSHLRALGTFCPKGSYLYIDETTESEQKLLIRNGPFAFESFESASATFVEEATK